MQNDAPAAIWRRMTSSDPDPPGPNRNKWTADPRQMTHDELLGLPVINSTGGQRPIRRFRDQYGRVWDVIQSGAIHGIVYVRHDIPDNEKSPPSRS